MVGAGLYGARIFYTNHAGVWEYVNRFTCFNRFTNSPIAIYKGEIYSLPFHMCPFNRMRGIVTPEEAAVRKETSSSADVWESTGIMIWMP